MVRNGLFGVAQRCQVIGLVPLEQQVAEGEQLVLLPGRQIDSEFGEAVRQRDHAQAACDRLCRLRWMSSSEIAAGVMP
ncbi:hypothetical protein SDC9_170999 [bioreactor metagenome]|uniref:Uncharacterized protein n=1 Tax=bioreactor metagenome TaxID=1076179 RepID=A0A645G9M3_9ZZZZ